jgi:Fur family transcriptional regulator, peroxide stress response regulator
MIQPSTDEIVQTLKAKGLRVTPQRFAVYANLLSRNDHPTVEQIRVDLNQYCPVSSQATVYSSLQALHTAGLIREVLLEAGISRYDAKVTPHHHFHCQQCGSIEDIGWDALPMINFDRLRSGLQAHSYEITIRGCCDRCQPISQSASIS